jgi:hypothetical protein
LKGFISGSTPSKIAFIVTFPEALNQKPHEPLTIHLLR